MIILGPSWSGKIPDWRAPVRNELRTGPEKFRTESGRIPDWRTPEKMSSGLVRKGSGLVRKSSGLSPEKFRTGPENSGLGKVAKSSTAAGGLLADLADWRAGWRTWQTGGLCMAGLADWRTRVWRTLANSGQALADSGGLSWSWRTLADLADSGSVSSGSFLARAPVQFSCQEVSGHNSSVSSVSSVWFS